jgi:hypothetical protein
MTLYFVADLGRRMFGCRVGAGCPTPPCSPENVSQESARGYPLPLFTEKPRRGVLGNQFPAYIVLGNSEGIKREPGLLLPAPFSSTAKLLVVWWVRPAAWAHKLTWTWWPWFLSLSLLGDLAGSRTLCRRACAVRVSERHASRDRQHRHREERYHEKSNHALHSFSPPSLLLLALPFPKNKTGHLWVY